MKRFHTYIATHRWKRIRSAPGGTVHKSIGGNKPALPQSFELSSSSEHYTRAFGDGPRHFEPWSSDVDEPVLASPLLTTTPHQREDVSAFDRFHVHRCPIRRVFSGTGLELMTCRP
ncbi:hypothetical protein TNCV_1240541 [Trichonephila clavipes]|uniref:Uncharacterized protein n=1 Tax=Trichonephila clavipes TaxID=2585209 RepID=A0A8X6WDT7_TRICX|nr:hypothetical protein TNCV_1240541 [Trichonephila clavipes]